MHLYALYNGAQPLYNNRRGRLRVQIFDTAFEGYTMNPKIVELKTEYIKLSDLLKYTNIVSSGAEGKYLVLNGDVYVNGEQEFQRGKKIYPGMEISGKYNGEDFYITVV